MDIGIAPQFQMHIVQGLREGLPDRRIIQLQRRTGLLHVRPLHTKVQIHGN
jgi:hypothetical protein